MILELIELIPFLMFICYVLVIALSRKHLLKDYYDFIEFNGITSNGYLKGRLNLFLNLKPNNTILEVASSVFTVLHYVSFILEIVNTLVELALFKLLIKFINHLCIKVWRSLTLVLLFIIINIYELF